MRRDICDSRVLRGLNRTRAVCLNAHHEQRKLCITQFCTTSLQRSLRSKRLSSIDPSASTVTFPWRGRVRLCCHVTLAYNLVSSLANASNFRITGQILPNFGNSNRRPQTSNDLNRPARWLQESQLGRTHLVDLVNRLPY